MNLEVILGPSGSYKRYLAPFLVLALMRTLYFLRARAQQQKRVHRMIQSELANSGLKIGSTSPEEEWITVDTGDKDSAKFASLVYKPTPSANADPTASKLVVLLLPGNPGLPHFYLPLMQLLVEKHGLQCEVRCLSQTNHYMPHVNSSDSVHAYSFRHQSEIKKAYLKQRLADNPNEKYVLIGHSIGCHIGLSLLQAFPDQVLRLVWMQPALQHMGSTPKGSAMMPLFKYHQAVKPVCKLIEWMLPVSVRMWIIRKAIAKDGLANDRVLQLAVLSLINADVANNALRMALHEMEYVKELSHESLMTYHQDKMLFVYSPVDDWVPGTFAQEYQVKFPKARHRIVPQGHGFMMEEQGTEDMSAHISQWLEDVWPSIEQE